MAHKKDWPPPCPGTSGVVPPPFCKYICPAGTLGGGIPLLLANPGLRQAAGWLFGWKTLVLAAVAGLSMVIHRPFCRYRTVIRFFE